MQNAELDVNDVTELDVDKNKNNKKQNQPKKKNISALFFANFTAFSNFCKYIIQQTELKS